MFATFLPRRQSRDPLSGVTRIAKVLRANAAARCDMVAVHKIDDAVKVLRTESLKPALAGGKRS